MSTVPLCPKAHLRRRPTVCGHKLHTFNVQVKIRVIQYLVMLVDHIIATSRKRLIWIAEKCNLPYQYLTMSSAITVVRMG